MLMGAQRIRNSPRNTARPQTRHTLRVTDVERTGPDPVPHRVAPMEKSAASQLAGSW